MAVFEPGKIEIKILLVDDRKENIVALEKLLEDNDYSIQFLKATSGQEALKIAFYEDLALILLDVQMPEMDGFEVANILQTNNKTKNVPIVFVTASDYETNRVLLGYQTGGIDYLFKPLNPAITKAKVKSFIRMYIHRREAEILSHLVSNSLDLMCVVEFRTLKILSANPAWEYMLGYKQEELNGRTFGSIVFCKDNKDGLNLNEIFGENISAKNIETCVLSKSDEVKFILWTFVRKDNLWYCNGREYTDRKIAEDQLHIAQESLVKLNLELEERVNKRTEELRKKNDELRKINADLDNFIYTASHDLKAPMSNIEGLVEALHADFPGNEEAQKLFGMIDVCVGKFKRVINDLTDMARAQSEEVIDETILPFKEMVDEVKVLVTDMIRKYDPVFVEDYSACGKVRFSRKNLRSVLYNLITNAIKFSYPGRRPIVKIKTVPMEGYTLLTVEDNGLGIKEQDKSKVFSMFKRLHDHVEGTGMGMSMVKRIIDNSGGKIELESKVGEGSVFKIFFNEKETVC